MFRHQPDKPMLTRARRHFLRQKNQATARNIRVNDDPPAMFEATACLIF